MRPPRRLAACLEVVRLELGEAHDPLHQCLAARRVGRERAHGLEALQRVLLRDLGVAGDQRRVGGLDDRELVLHALGIGEAQPPGLPVDRDALAGEPLGPEVERRLGADAMDDRLDHPRARPARRRARVLEERDVGARRALLVGVEEVVDARVVLVDGLLDEPEAEHAHVEVDVLARVPGDQR